MDYSVEYNKNGIFQIVMTMEGLGAYPDSSNKRFVINLKSGDKLKAADIFQNAPQLLTLVKKKVQRRNCRSEKGRTRFGGYVRRKQIHA